MNIVFYGGHKWESGPWFRKQQFASRLAKRGHKVFYIESGISMFRKKRNDEYSYFKSRFKKVNDNLVIISPSTMLPFPNNYYLRYVYNLKLLLEIKRYLRKHHIRDYLVWFNQVEFASVIKLFKQIKIFDLADDRPYYSVLANDYKGYKTMLKYVKLAFRNSDISTVSAQKIKDKYQDFSKSEILVIPNGHNIYFNRSVKYAIPEDIKYIKKPIIGFVGTLFRFIDEDLLSYLAVNRPHYNFVFVGPVQDNFPIDKLNSLSNVFLLGEKTKSEIPNYINSFNLCLNPFKVHEVNDSVSPVKVFEYLAMQKKVISTQMYSLQKEIISKYINFASDYMDFMNQMDCILNDNDIDNCVDEDILAQYSWDNLFLNLISSLNKNQNLHL